MKRREMLKMVGAAPAAVALTLTADETTLAADAVARGREQAAQAGQAYKLRFFTPREYAAVTALADMIIPKDAKSVSASEAGAPEFIDYIVAEQPDRQVPMRGGLAWLDAECLKRFDKPFLDTTDAQRRLVLDDIAYPARTRPELRHGARFFSSLRDLVAAGFWSSKVGVEDLGYLGNRPSLWDGPPPAVLKKLGLE